MRFAILLAAGLLAAALPARADEPTVSLTQSELTSLVAAEVAAALARDAAERARPAIDKARAAFAPPAPASSAVPSGGGGK